MHDQGIPARPEWAILLREATTLPGTISKAYSAFHGYSLGNQLLAAFECSARNIQPGPIATYKHWQSLGRQVRKGEKAIHLWMPITGKRSASDDDDDREAQTFTRFMFAAKWFTLAQTDGEPVATAAAPGWDRNAAIQSLKITEIPFTHPDGNVQGFALPAKRQLAISPLAHHPLRTTVHELAHVLLHGDEEQAADSADLPRSLKEVEAEATALLVMDALNEPTAESRGYIQSWYGAGNEIPNANAARIMKAADTILRAGATS